MFGRIISNIIIDSYRLILEGFYDIYSIMYKVHDYIWPFEVRNLNMYIH